MRGVVQQVGSPLDLYDRPANLFVAGFIGSPAMNFLAARYEAKGGSSRRTTGRRNADCAVSPPTSSTKALQ